MPIYEYRCKKCGHTFEVMQKFSDPPIKRCEKCKGRVEKVLSAPGLLFKGAGWYVTDYANPSRKQAMEAEKKASDNGKGTGDEKEKKDSKAKAKDKDTG